LIEAFAGLDQTKAQLHVYGIGAAEYEASLRQRAVGANIHFHGEYRPADIGHINAAIDVGVIPSIWEELFGLVGVEYIQSRVPVIASQIGGLSEYIHHGETGLLVPAGNRARLASALQQFIDQPALIPAMQQNLARWITVEAMTAALDAMYQDLLVHA
jgi:glycosyltransferase involved in cell wall biosynthesis